MTRITDAPGRWIDAVADRFPAAAEGTPGLARGSGPVCVGVT